MTLMTLIDEACVHREVYTTVLRGLLSARGSKQALARQVGVTPQYLSYLLAPADAPAESQRDPSPEVAARLVNALPLAPTERDALLEHLLLANRKRLAGRQQVQRELADLSPDAALAACRQTHERACFARDPEESRRRYAMFAEQSEAVLQALARAHDPVAYAYIAIMAHDVACVRDQPVRALWWAKQARATLEAASPRSPDHGQDLPGLLVNAIRAEAVACHNLNLPRDAYRLCSEAEAVIDPRDRERRAFWLPHLYRDKINALANTPRFAVAEIEGLAAQVEDACAHLPYGDDVTDLLTALIHTSLINAWSRYGGERNRRKAESLACREYERLDRLRYFGALHRTQTLRSSATLCWQRGDRQEWAFFIGLALQTARAAGLAHQIHEMQQEYGGYLDDIL